MLLMVWSPSCGTGPASAAGVPGIVPLKAIRRSWILRSCSSSGPFRFIEKSFVPLSASSMTRYRWSSGRLSPLGKMMDSWVCPYPKQERLVVYEPRTCARSWVCQRNTPATRRPTCVRSCRRRSSWARASAPSPGSSEPTCWRRGPRRKSRHGDHFFKAPKR